MTRPVEVGAFPAEPRAANRRHRLFVVPTISLKLLYGLIIVPASSAEAGLDQRAAHLPAEKIAQQPIYGHAGLKGLKPI
jgi:hypothetical protein